MIDIQKILLNPKLKNREYQDERMEEICEKTIEFFETLMKLLHPFMPFITEEVWHELKERKEPIIGVGGSIHDIATTPGYHAVGKGHILLVEGDNTSGIIELRKEYESSTLSHYGKFEIIANSTSTIGDELQLEFFPTLIDAQSGFTVNVSTYERIYTPTLDDIVLPPATTPSNEGILFIYPIILSIVLISIIPRKKKK